MKLVHTLSLALAAAAAAVFGTPAAAQNFPTQRVTIVVPFGAGSVTDIMARILADEASKRWNQPVIVENRPGLAGTAAVSKADPDGYTLMLTSNGHTVAGLVNKGLTFDPVKDFVGITRVSSVPLYLIVKPDLPAKDLKEVVALAKAKPGALNFSSPGLASTTFIAGACSARRRPSTSCMCCSERARRRDGGGARRRGHVFRAREPVEGNGRSRKGAGQHR